MATGPEGRDNPTQLGAETPDAAGLADITTAAVQERELAAGAAPAELVAETGDESAADADERYRLEPTDEQPAGDTEPVPAAGGAGGGEQPPFLPPVDTPEPGEQPAGEPEPTPAAGGAGGGGGDQPPAGGDQPPAGGEDENNVQAQLDQLREQVAALTAQNTELIGLLRQSVENNERNIDRLVDELRAERQALIAQLNEQRPQIENRTGRAWTGRRIAAAAAAGVAAVALGLGIGKAVWGGNDGSSTAKPEGNTPSKLTANERKELKLLSNYMHTPDENSPEAKILLKKLHKAEDAKTVAGTAARLDANSKDVKAYVALLGSKLHKPDIVDHTTTRDAVNSMQKFEQYGGKDKNQYDYAVAVADAVASSDANAAAYYNIMNGNSGQTELPAGVSLAQARAAIFQKLTQEGTKFSIENPTGTWKNYGQNGEHVYVANIEHTNGNQRMFVVTYADGSKMFFKLYKGAGGEDCVNFNVPVKITFRTTNPVIEQHFGPQPTPSHKVMGPIHGTNPDHPKIHNPHQPEKPCPPDEIVPPPPHVTPPAPKVDHNTTPAGVPDEPRGSGGNGQEVTRPVAGPAPANVGQPQAPTPAPEQPQHSETTTTPEIPTVTGNDPGTTGPAEQDNIPGTEKPAQPVSSATTPVGE